MVARAAQVSTATASKVLNNRPDVAPATRQRVEVVLRELGYEPTTGPREVRRTPLVTVIFDSLINMYSTQLLRGVLAAATELDVDIVVEDLSHFGGRAVRPMSVSWIHSLAPKGWLGVLVVSTEVSLAQARAFRDVGMHLVVVDAPNALDDSIFSVGPTNFKGGLQATNHLVQLGHRRIALAGGPLRSSVARERLHGYRSALEAADIVPEDELIRHGEFGFEAGLEMSLAFLVQDRPPTAIVAGCDATALGIIEGARRTGVRIPQDLSVVGFDDTPAAASSAPPLTTIRQPMVGLGRMALRTLLQQAAGEQPLSHHIQLATSLILRESTAAPASTTAASGTVRAIRPTGRATRA